MPAVNNHSIVRGAALLLAAWCAPGFAADDLWTLYRLALSNDARYQQQQFDRRAERAEIPIARSRFGPTLSATAGRSRIHGTDMTSFGNDEGNGGSPGPPPPDITYDETTYGLQLSQVVYKPANRNLYQQAKIGGEIADLVVTGARHELIMRLAERYFQMLSAGDDLVLSNSETAAIGSQLKRARERHEVGLGARTAVYEAEARFELARAAGIEATNGLKDARRGVMELVDVEVEALTPLAADAQLAMPDPDSEEEWVTIALEQSVEIAAAKKRSEVAKKEIRRLRYEIYPSLDLGLNYSYSDNEGGQRQFNPNRSTRATLSLSVPLWSSGLARNSHYRATVRYQSVQAGVEATRRAVERSSRAAYQDVVSAVHRVAALEAAVNSGEGALRARRDEYEVGLSTNSDVLDAQRDSFSARRDYLRARYNYILALLRLKQVSGTLDDKDVQAINTLLAAG